MTVRKCPLCGSPEILLFRFYACANACHRLEAHKVAQLRQRNNGVDDAW